MRTKIYKRERNRKKVFLNNVKRKKKKVRYQKYLFHSKKRHNEKRKIK